MTDTIARKNEQTRDCERFAVGTRLREICEGASDLPLKQINRYREHWNLPPLSEEEAPPRQIPLRSTSVFYQKSDALLHKRLGNGTSGCSGCGGSRQKQPPRLSGVGPGSKLLEDFAAAGVPHCEECLALAVRMDAWGKHGCEDHLHEIVEDILPRAREWMVEKHQWIHTFLKVSLLEDASLRKAIAVKVRKAIDSAVLVAGQQSQRAIKAKETKQRTKGKSKIQVDRKGFPSGRHWARSFQPTNGLPRFVSAEQLVKDTLSLIPRLPSGIVMVAGSARSGLIPASLVSMMLHLPMTIIRNRQGDFIPAGHGWRLLEGAPAKSGKMLIIDDTTMTGNSLLRMKQVLKDEPSEKIWASVYCNPTAVNKPDLWAVDLPWPHLLEWNLFNSVLLDSFALDFDGILCDDCLPEEDDDGSRYKKFLREVRPLYLVRKRRIGLIITARLEKYREDTIAWMDHWGVEAKQLVMGPWDNIHERRNANIAAWKASKLEQFFKQKSKIPPKFYIESNPILAQEIASLSGRLVVCPAAKQCFGKVS